MPAFVRYQVVLPFRTHNSTDVATNTWHFESDSLGNEAATDIISPAIEAFYDAITVWLSPALEGGDCYMKWYDMVAPEPREPTLVPMVLATTPTPTPLPLEVAAVLSFEGNPPVVASRRGRIYLGPLNTAILNKDVIGRPFIRDEFFTAVAQGLENMAAAGVDQSAVRHVIYSRKNLITVAVNRYSMNNEFDTMRSRESILDSVRTVWDAPVSVP